MNEIAIPEKSNLKAGGAIMAVVPQTFDEAARYAQMVLKTGMFPDNLKSKTPQDQVASVTGIILKGLEVGLPPFSALSNIMEVNKRYCVWGDGAMALVRNSGLLEWADEHTEGLGDNLVAICRLKRKEDDQVIERRFSVTEAKTAKLWGKVGPWMAFPNRMLQMRARSFALRDGFADVLQGLSIAEEVQDLPTVKEVVETSFLDDAPKTETPALPEPTPEKPVCEICEGRGVIETPDGKEPCECQS